MLTINFKKWNILLGWGAFLIAFITYSLTVEPTVSFWDAGEYIATSSNLEVGHPPGAPLYQMLGALFSLFALQKENIALMVNMVAATSSAFTILFMFWCSTNILKKITSTSEEDINNQKAIAILGSSFIGALTFTFTDTFWFSAVEAEVYATSTFLIALLLWLGLRWTDKIDSPDGNKWLLLIALVIGLSFGVHFMALLTIPSIGYLYYFKKYPKVTLVQFILANIIIVSILLFVFLFLMPYTMTFFGKSEIFFVNTFGLPFNSGTIIAFTLLIGAFVFGILFTQKRKMAKANTFVLALVFLFIGFSSWLMLPIRANTQIPINENKPSDAAEMLAYYNREQYGTRSLFYDTYFTTKYRREQDSDKPFVDGKPNYERDLTTGKYVIVNRYENAEPNVSRKLKGFLPRMYSTDGNHPVNYMRYTKPLDFKVKDAYAGEAELAQMEQQIKSGLLTGEISIEEYDSYLSSREFSEYFEIQNPTFIDNMKFMFDYQFGYMYWRYLMWNFSGRQNDIQGSNDRIDGNWVTGIPFLDEIRLGSQKNLPSDTLDNKGRNHYYMLPFLLGLFGFAFHFRKDPKTFYVLLALFLFNSFALKIFLNERPFEPRERDYAVVGSFMVYAIWVGFGVYALHEELKKLITNKITLPIALATGLLVSPVLLAKENWDDHDRSEKYTALATAKAYLDSCDPNAIIFTIGDNDTFPLWYLQEVEQYRTDVRVVCTALLQADWYIDQMRVKSRESDALKIRFDHKQYAGNNLEYALISPSIDDRIDLEAMLSFIQTNDPRARVKFEDGTELVNIPTNKLRIPINKENILKNKVVSEKFADQIVSDIEIDIKSSALYRQRIMMFDIIANNNWERPIYFTGGSITDEDFLWMKDYLQLDGYAYKLVPIKSSNDINHPLYIGGIDSDKMFDNVTKWYWGNYGSSDIYHDPETRKNSLFFRTYLTRLAEKLIEEGKNEKALKIADLTMQHFPIAFYGNYTSLEPFAEIYYILGKKEKAIDILKQVSQKYHEQLYFYQSMSGEEQNEFAFEIVDTIRNWERLIDIANKYDQPTAKELSVRLKSYKEYYIHLLKAFGLDEESLKKAAEQAQKEADSIIQNDGLK